MSTPTTQQVIDAIKSEPLIDSVAKCLYGKPTRFDYVDGAVIPIQHGEPGYDEARYEMTFQPTNHLTPQAT